MSAAWVAALVLAASPGVPAAPAAPASAGCLLRAGDGVLMVQDVWSRRWSVPGGGRCEGESGAAAAERETREELGLAVVAGRELLRTATGFAVYACTLAQPGVPMHGDEVALPDAARLEIAAARVQVPQALPPAAWRFPAQRAPLSALATAAAEALPPAPLVPVAASNSALLNAELAANRALQAVALPGWDALLRAASRLGEISTVALLVALLWALWPWRQAAELCLVVLATCLLGCLIKQGVALPRPCYLEPALRRAAVDGFGFPSGHTTAAATAAGMLVRRAARRWQGALAGAAVALCGGARVYLGAHFVHDVVGGAALAAAALALHAAALRRTRLAALPPRRWAVAVGLLATVTLVVQPQPTPVFLTAMFFGLLGGCAACRPAPAAPRLAWAAACVATMALAEALAARLRPASGAFLPCLRATVLAGLLLGLALPALQWAAQRWRRPPTG